MFLDKNTKFEARNPILCEIRKKIKILHTRNFLCQKSTCFVRKLVKINASNVFNRCAVDVVSTEVVVTDSEVPYGCCEKFSRATFTLSIHRNPLYYIIRVVMPCCLLSFVAVFTYFLQPSRPERLAIS